MAIDPARVKALFQAAIEHGDPEGRAAFLDREVGGDSELRERLVALLAVHDGPPGVLDRPLDADVDATVEASDAPRPASPPSTREGREDGPTVAYQGGERPGLVDTVIAGRYKVRQEIGEGGMGSVYLAEQTHPVKRQVALKLIKAGMDSRTVLARFESERQALALMDHPNIAKVLDAGTTDAGRPFFVMDLVKGIPLTDYCDQHQLGLPERLNLFRQICSAVQHAHQKGIIHRDLKPTNILVESHDDKPVPKVIDFGLAKATSGIQLSEHSLFSAFGSVAGTPLYMAPEQATFNAVDIDTRADIYALGVILYELLTGSTPIRRETMKRAALDEMLRVIREDEPPTPSSRISSSETLPNLAASRHVEPARLSRLVRGDLDWIVMKALAKERSRRYDSAIGLANDIERFTNHEPVSAGPPTARYRLGKFVRRNRGRVVAASLVLLALVGGIVGTTLGLFEANRQKGRAIAQEQQTRRRLDQRNKANAILLSIFADLDVRGGDKETLPLPDRLGRNLDAATAALEGEATDDPVGVARMQAKLGRAQLALGHADKAILLLAKARDTLASRLGPDDPETFVAAASLGTSYQADGRLDLALPILEEAATRAEAKLGPDHPDTLGIKNNLAWGLQAAGKLDRALPLLEETVARARVRLGPDHPNTRFSMDNLASAYRRTGKLDRALPILEDSAASLKARLGPDHPDTLISMNDLATAYQAAGKLDRALPILEETVERSRAKLGPDHPDTLSVTNNLATAYQAAGKLDRALPLLERTLVLTEAKLGPEHPNTLRSKNNLASGYRAAGRPDRALTLHEETLERLKAKLGPDHPDTLATMSNLATSLQDVGRHDRAMPLLEETLALMKVKLGPVHPLTLTVMNNVAWGYRTLKQHDRSIPLYEEVLRLRVATSGTDHPDTWVVRANLGANYSEAGRPVEALPLLEGAYRKSREQPQIRWVSEALLIAYLRADRSEEAAAQIKEMLAERRSTLPEGSPQLAATLAQTASALMNMKAWATAEPLLRECLEIREKTDPEAWTTFNTRSMLGAALLGRKQHADAEPLLRSGYEGMKARADKMPSQFRDLRLGEALDRLIALAEATNKPDEAKAWKEERAKLSADATPKPK